MMGMFVDVNHKHAFMYRKLTGFSHIVYMLGGKWYLNLLRVSHTKYMTL